MPVLMRPLTQIATMVVRTNGGNSPHATLAVGVVQHVGEPVIWPDQTWLFERPLPQRILGHAGSVSSQ